jgi:hypothetical protein
MTGELREEPRTSAEVNGKVSETAFCSSPLERGVVQALVDEHARDNQEHDARGRT